MPFVLAATLPELFPAVVLVFLLWAVWTLFQRPLLALLENIPVVGYNLAQAVGAAIITVIRWVRDWVGQAAAPFVQLLAVPIQAILDFGAGTLLAIETAAGAIASLTSRVVGTIGDLVAHVAGLLVTVSGLVSIVAAIRAAITSLSSRIAAVIATTIPQAIAALRVDLIGLVDAARAELTRLFGTAIAAVRAWAAAALATAVRALEDTITAVRAALLAAIAVAVRPIQAELDALGRLVAGTVAGILARLATLEGLLPLALLLPLVTAIPRTIEQFWRTKNECVDPTCDFLGDALNGLGAVGEALTGSVLLALVAEAIANPQGAAETIAGFGGELHGLADDVTTVLAGRSL